MFGIYQVYRSFSVTPRAANIRHLHQIMTAPARQASALVSTKWLSERLGKPGIKIVDASWHLPSAKRDPKAEFAQKHIPNAQFFAIDGCCTPSKAPHMLPQTDQFAEYVGKELGIDNNSHVVVYDNHDKFALFSAQRVWWTFRMFGHEKVSLLEGGLPQWTKDGGATTSKIDSVVPAEFKANFQSHLVKSFEDVERNLSEKAFHLLDARPQPRFDGKAPEPRADIKPGHIPDSQCLPFLNMLNVDDRTMKSPEEMKAVFKSFGIDLDKPVVASCGSGVTACVLALAAFQCGKDMPVYDGAWGEWFFRAKDEQKCDVPE